MKLNERELKISLAIVLVLFGILVLLVIIKTKKFYECRWELYEISYKNDSLEKLSYLRGGEECEFFGKNEESILAFLPPPTFTTSDTLLTPLTDEAGFWPAVTGLYLRHLQYDDNFEPVLVHERVWKNMLSVRNTLEICFALQDSVWIAVACMEYDSNSIEF